MPKTISLILFSLLSMGLVFPSVHAETESPKQHIIQFESNHELKIENDVVTVTLQAYGEALSAKEVMHQINQKMEKALKVLNSQTDVEFSHGQYQVLPILNKDKTTAAWKGTQTVMLTTQKVPGLVGLLPKLQPYLYYRSMQFSPSPERQAEAQAELLRVAMKAYQTKAATLAKGFGFNHYTLIETRINQFDTPRPVMMEALMAKNNYNAQTAPQIHTGQSVLRVQLSGKIGLPNRAQ